MAYGAHVQSRAVNSGSGTSSPLAYLSNNVANNTLTAFIHSQGNPGTVGIFDSRGNTPWTSLLAVNDGQSWINIYFLPSSTAGANTITVTSTNAVIKRWIIAEHEGVSSNSGLSANDSDFGTFLYCGGMTTTTPNSLIFAVGGTSAAATWDAGSPSIKRAEIERIVMSDRVESTTGFYEQYFSITSGANAWIGCGVTLYGSAVTVIPYTQRERGLRGVNRGLEP